MLTPVQVWPSQTISDHPREETIWEELWDRHQDWQERTHHHHRIEMILVWGVGWCKPETDNTNHSQTLPITYHHYIKRNISSHHHCNQRGRHWVWTDHLSIPLRWYGGWLAKTMCQVSGWFLSPVSSLHISLSLCGQEKASVVNWYLGSHCRGSAHTDQVINSENVNCF